MEAFLQLYTPTKSPLSIKKKGAKTILAPSLIFIKFYHKAVVIVKIKDNGKGIPEKDLNEIFTAGYTTKGVGVGTGLGLAICYKIIEKHNGEILVNSELGKGSEFIITICGE